jgi:hypothetical protein
MNGARYDASGPSVPLVLEQTRLLVELSRRNIDQSRALVLRAREASLSVSSERAALSARLPRSSQPRER